MKLACSRAQSTNSVSAKARHHWWPLGCLLVGFALSAGLGWWVRRDGLQRDEQRFQILVENSRQLFDAKVEQYESALDGLRVWMSTLEVPSLREWDNQIEQMSLSVKFKGIVEIGYAPVIHSGNLSRWKNRIPAHWQDYWPHGPVHDDWRQVTYATTPPEWNTHNLMDYAAMSAAGNTWASAYQISDMRTTDRRWVADQNGRHLAGFWAFLATYNRDMAAGEQRATVKNPRFGAHRGNIRGEALIGTVVASIAIEPLIASAFGDKEREEDFELYAGPVKEIKRMTHLERPAFALTPAYASGLHTNYVIPWYGEKWTMAFYPTPAFYRQSQADRGWLVLVAGIGLTLALSTAFLIQARARQSAEQWNEDLQDARDDLREAQGERQRISRDLHDSVLQSLYAGILHARIIERHISTDPLNAKADLEQHIGQLEEAMRETRRFLTGGGSAAMSVQEAVDTLRTFTDLYNRQGEHRLEFGLSGELTGTLPGTAAEHLLPITRESVSNAIRHGQATHIELSISSTPGLMRLEIKDNGIGFNPGAVRQPNHGLDNLASRAASFGGRFQIESQPGGPTVVQAEFPLLKGETLRDPA